MDNRRKDGHADVAWRQSQTASRPEMSKEEYLRRKAMAMKRRRRRRIRTFIFAAAVTAVLVVGIILIYNNLSSGGTIAGTWDYDGVTKYRFDDNGTGTLLLPNSNYDFSYTIHDDQIAIDFVSEDAVDNTYLFSVKGRKLVFYSVDTGTEYVFKKMRKR